MLAPPGVYTVRLERGDPAAPEVLGSHSLQVIRDPRSAGTAAELAEQQDVLASLWQEVDRAARWINEIEWLRRQLQDQRARLSALIEEAEEAENRDEEAANLRSLVDGSEQLEEQLMDFEGNFFDLRLTGAGQDSLRWKRLLYSRMTYLAWGIAKTDHRPTDAQREVYDLYRGQMEAHGERWQGLRQEVHDFNGRLTAAGLGGLLLGSEPGTSSTDGDESAGG